MDKDLEIKTVGQTKLDNAMHVTYHTEMHGILKSADQAKTGIPAEIMTDYNGGITEETELNREAQADALTAELVKADTARDRAVQYFFASVRAARLSPDEAVQKAAAALMPTVSVYSGAPTEAADRETALISGLVVDMKKAELTAHLTTLHLADLPAKLEALNKAFADLATKRSDGRAATKLPLASKVRPRTDAAYERILFTLRSNYLFGSTPIEKPAIEALAARLNQRAAELDAAWKQSSAQKKRAPRKPSVPKEPKQPKEPKDPKQPKDPKDPKKPGGDPKQPEQPKDPKKPGGGSGEQPQPGGEKPKKPGGDGNPDITLPEE